MDPTDDRPPTQQVFSLTQFSILITKNEFFSYKIIKFSNLLMRRQ
jgi:hypothetical protein